MTKVKRRLFDDIKEGFEALEAERQGRAELHRSDVITSDSEDCSDKQESDSDNEMKLNKLQSKPE